MRQRCCCSNRSRKRSSCWYRFLEEQTISSKINRDAAADGINGQIVQQQVMNQSLQQMTTGMGETLQNFRMP